MDTDSDTGNDAGNDDATAHHRPRPGPGPVSHAAPADGTTRRWFLAGGVAIVLGAGGGVAAEFARHHDSGSPAPKPPPDTLVAAVAAERALIADLDATTGGAPAVRLVIKQARADHVAHLRTLKALVAGSATPSSSTSTPAPRGTARTLAQLRSAEKHAATTSAHRAAGLDGPVAALFASISACEAVHAELLT